MNKLLTTLAVPLTASLLSAYQIVLDPAATTPEKNAASELAKYLPQLSQAQIEAKIHIDDKPGTYQKPAIFVGKTGAALKVFGLNDWSSLKPDEILYKVTEDGSLWIAGEGTRGTIYAVYEVLEREYGVRFLTADAEYIPQSPKFSLPAIGTSYRYAPAFISRSAGYDLVPKGGPQFACKLRNNFFNGVHKDWGGNDSIIGFVHTLAQMIPPEEYLEKHPEWFALRNGIRAGGQGNQMCLTNMELRQELLKKVRERLKADKGRSHFISVSQNDNQRYCQCDKCTAFVQEHGNQTDLLIDCVNWIADRIADEYPGVYVDTLAYNYTRQPPKTIFPHDNVAIRYCTIEARSFYPLQSPQNDKLYQEMTAWKKLAKKMLIWNYVTDFSRYYIPHPNWHTLAKDVRLFRECNAINIFQQGSWNQCAKAADLGDLRTYLVAKLLWNPDLDSDAIIQEFCRLYYGPTAPYVLDYIKSVTSLVQAKPELKDNCYAANTNSWMPAKETALIWKRMYDGVKAFQNDPVYGPRLAVAALPITMNMLDQQELLLPKPNKRIPELQDVDVDQLIIWCEKSLKIAQAEKLAESGSLSATSWIQQQYGAYSNKLILPQAPLAGGRPAGLPEGTWYAWNMEDLGQLATASKEDCGVFPDANAVDGKAIRMPNTHHQWYVQARELPRGIFDVYLTLRCDVKPGCKAEGPAISFGNYPAGPFMDNKITAAQLAGPEYKLIYLGKSNFAKANYFYCAPCLNQNVSYIWIDRLIVLNPTDADGNPLELLKPRK